MILTGVVNTVEVFFFPLPYNRNANVALKSQVTVNLQSVEIIIICVMLIREAIPFPDTEILKMNAHYIHHV